MNWEALREKLLEAARRNPPSSRVPYAFEKRVMASLASPARRLDDWPAVTRALWWAAGACSAVAVFMSVWTVLPRSSAENFTDDLEQSILASVSDVEMEADLEFLW
jgi:hypothetical protein